MASYILAGSIEISPDLLGTIRVGRANRYTPEDRKAVLGYRPSLPLLVNSLTVDTVSDIIAANVPDDGHFIISSSFTGGPGTYYTYYLEEFYSDEFETWDLYLATVDPNVITAPDGNQTADKLIESSGFGNHYARAMNLSVDGISSYRCTVYAKVGGRMKVQLLINGTGFPGAPFANFDLSTGTVITSISVDDAGIEDVGDGWYRCWITMTSNAQVDNEMIYTHLLSDAGSTPYSGDGSSGAYFWGALLERVIFGNPLYDQGAKPGSIGTKTVHGRKTIYVFRVPYENEVVWHVAIDSDDKPYERGFHHWDGETWQSYKTWPERALEGMQAFEFLDPDRIWEYYARVIGATSTEWMVDVRAMLDFIDPDRCPIELLPELAGNFGLAVDATEQEEVQRQKVRDAIPTYKLKGLPRAVELRLRSLGYTGYPREIWVNPDNPNNWTDDTTGEKGNDWMEVIHGSRYRVPRIGLLFVGAEQPFDGETVVINDHTTTVTFGFGSGGDVTVTIGADAEETRDNLVAAINASALTVEASETPMTDWPEVTLDGGKISADSAVIRTFNYYVPSSRISIHINRIGGQPLSMTTPASALGEFEQFIAGQLGEDVLPAPIDIRFFATDLEVGPSGFDLGEELEVDDAMVLTEVP